MAHMPVIPALRRQEEEDQAKVVPDNTVSSQVQSQPGIQETVWKTRRQTHQTEAQGQVDI